MNNCEDLSKRNNESPETSKRSSLKKIETKRGQRSLTTHSREIRTRGRRVKGMDKKTKHERVGKNQQKILDILEKYQELTARDLAEIIWARDIRYKTAEYSSVHRSLRALRERGVVEKVGGQVKWRRTTKTQ